MTEPRKKGRQGRRYSDEFKREAVNLLTNTPASAAEISAQLGISVGTLWRWHKLLTERTSPAEQPSYEELEKEVGRLKVENDFLKKASSYFASRQPTGIR